MILDPRKGNENSRNEFVDEEEYETAKLVGALKERMMKNSTDSKREEEGRKGSRAKLEPKLWLGSKRKAGEMTKLKRHLG